MMPAMFRASVAASVGAVFLVGAATPAHADASLHALINIRNGWTDNLQSGESDTSTPPKEADFYSQVVPGLLATFERPRLIQELYAEAEANLYLEASEGASLSYRGGWRGFFLLSPLSEMTTSVQASGGVLNTFNTQGPSQTGEPVFLPSAQSRFMMIEARELYSRQLSRAVRVNQTGSARAFSSIVEGAADRSTGYEVGLGFGADRAWNFNALGISVSGTYAVLGAGTTDPNQSMFTSITGSWRRDLSARWSTLVDVGATVIVPVDTEDQASYGPTAGVQIGYYPEWGSAGLSARRTIAPNVFLQANTINDMATANAWLPLPWLRRDPRQPRLTFGGSVGAGWTQMIDPGTGQEYSGSRILLADVGFGYEIRDQMHTGLRYQYLDQSISDEAQANLMLANLTDYERHTVLLTFYARWPARVAAEVPIRGSLRVDRSDNTAVGEEASPQGGGDAGGGR
jgi:hypothetical protein